MNKMNKKNTAALLSDTVLQTNILLVGKLISFLL